MKRIVLMLLLLTIVGCSNTKIGSSIDLSNRIYTGQKSQEYLNFNNNSYTLTSPSFRTFNDTLSFGEWKRENNMIVLNSNKDYTNEYFDIEVEESISGSKDSLYIIIENPEIGLTFLKGGLTDYPEEILVPYINYILYLEKANGEGYSSDAFGKKLIIENYSEAKYLEDRRKKIKWFDIRIIPNLKIYPLDIFVNDAKTYTYKPIGSQNNTFKIKVKDFDYRFFSRRKFENEYIKIINKDTLFWHKQLYVLKKK